MKTLIFTILISMCYPVMSQDLWERTNYLKHGEYISFFGICQNNNIYICERSGGHVKPDWHQFAISQDNGENWVYNDSLQIRQFKFCNNGIIYGLGYKGSIKNSPFIKNYPFLYMSEDFGNSWSGVETPDSAEIKVIAFKEKIGDKDAELIISTHSDDIYSSKDNGNSWDKLSFPDSNIEKVFCSPDGDIFVYTDTLFFSRDGGQIWEKSISNLRLINDMKFHPNGKIFISEDRFQRDNMNLLYSDDKGETFQDTHFNLLEFLINTKGELFAGTESGVYCSKDNGLNWTSYGLDTMYVNHMAINSEGILFAAASTDSMRIFRTINPATSINNESFTEVISTFKLSQNYPNPFNPTTKITFTLPKSEHVILTVYNILGKKVTTLLETKMNAGFHDVQFDASALPSGIYFYRIEAGKFNEVKKMVLLR